MVTLIGPTASGKTSLAAHLAYALGSEVISADSRQVYRGMDIGTGKDLSEYTVNGQAIPYHLIDIVPAGSRYNLFCYQQDFHQALTEIYARGIQQPILCGGTGLYIESILRGDNLPDVPENTSLREELRGLSMTALKERLDSYGAPSHHNKLDTTQRLIRAIEIAEYRKVHLSSNAEVKTYAPISSTIICLTLDRVQRRSRITRRLHERLECGLVEEVQGLLSSGIHPDDLIYYGLEYKWVTLYLLKSINYKDMVEQLEIAIHQFAKRQMTWFRGMSRRGFTLHEVDALAPMDAKVEHVTRLVWGASTII